VALGCARYLQRANDTLQRLVDQFPDHRVADHARLAGQSAAGPYKLLDPSASTIAVLEPEPITADALLTSALVEQPNRAADTLGHIAFAEAAERHAAVLAATGQPHRRRETWRWPSGRSPTAAYSTR
jgi:hypothetical protein